MTLAETILAARCGTQEVAPGEFLDVPVDLVMTTDATGLISMEQFRRMGAKRAFDPRKIVFVMDHFVPARTVESAEAVQALRCFAKELGAMCYEGGHSGVCHVLLPEQGLVAPAEVVVGGDSHTCTYGALGAFATGMGSTDIAAAMATGRVWMRVPETLRLVYHGRPNQWVGGKDLILHTIGLLGVDGATYMAMEFTGETLQFLDMDHRFTMANMAVEAGAKAGLFPVDARTLEYLRARVKRHFWVPPWDPKAACEKTVDLDVTTLEPQVATPHSPANVKDVSSVQGIAIDQVVIGSCTNGRIGDLRLAAQVLEGKKIHPEVRCLILPGGPQVYLNALEEGLVAIFSRAGAIVGPPTCGPCPGGHMGVLAPGERCVSTTNRNFLGRMGSPKAEIFLANPAVAAASAVLGCIAHPEEVSSK
ncbi:MAG: 3-isopropylmalate dehydratase large subunit [bacterium]